MTCTLAPTLAFDRYSHSTSYKEAECLKGKELETLSDDFASMQPLEEDDLPFKEVALTQSWRFAIMGTLVETTDGVVSKDQVWFPATVLERAVCPSLI